MLERYCSLYKLLVYLKDKENLFLIHTIYSDNKKELEELALEHKNNNLNYIAMILEYKTIEVTSI